MVAMQAGITLAFGDYKGRLIMPARVAGPILETVGEIITEVNRSRADLESFTRSADAARRGGSDTA